MAFEPSEGAAYPEEFNCAICMQLAVEAVESECCHHLFCESCVKVLASCPMCRAACRFVPSAISRRIIGRIPVTCPNNCGGHLLFADASAHRKSCPKRRLACAVIGCTFEGNRTELVAHICGHHQDVVVTKLCREPSSVCGESDSKSDGMAASAATQPSVIIIDATTNSAGRRARLGTTGKYYCGARTLRCRCCDGRCGPNSGCNCVPCMQLDKQARCLTDDFLVNSDGATCRISRATFYCGRSVMRGVPGCDGYCGPNTGPNCAACKALQANFEYYSSLCTSKV